MWIGRNRSHGNWSTPEKDEFDGMRDFAKVLEFSEDPEKLLREIGYLWNKGKDKD